MSVGVVSIRLDRVIPDLLFILLFITLSYEIQNRPPSSYWAKNANSWEFLPIFQERVHIIDELMICMFIALY